MYRRREFLKCAASEGLGVIQCPYTVGCVCHIMWNAVRIFEVRRAELVRRCDLCQEGAVETICGRTPDEE